MKTTDKIIIGGGLLVGIAGLMWYGNKLVTDGANAFAKGIQFPSINLSLPSFNPTINVPDYSAVNKSIFDGLQAVYKQTPAYDAEKLYGEIKGYIDSLFPQSNNTLYNVNGVKVQKVPVVSSGSQTTPDGWLPPIQNIFDSGGLFITDNNTKKSTSTGGKGIFVENGDKDYYVPDNSLYGGSSGMPVPQPETVFPEQPKGYYGKSGEEQAVKDSKEQSAAAKGGWYIKDGVWRQHGVDGY